MEVDNIQRSISDTKTAKAYAKGKKIPHGRLISNTPEKNYRLSSAKSGITNNISSHGNITYR